MFIIWFLGYLALSLLFVAGILKMVLALSDVFNKQEENKKYFVVTNDDSDDIVPGAAHIVRNDELCAQLGCINDYDDFDAAADAELDGIRLIHDEDGVYSGFYLDTPENRSIIAEFLTRNEFVVGPKGYMEYVWRG